MEQLEAKCKTLESKSITRDEDIQEWKGRCERLESDLEVSEMINSELEQKVETLGRYQAAADSLQAQNDQLQGDISRIQELLLAVTVERNHFEEQLSNETKDAGKIMGAEDDTKKGYPESTDADLHSEPAEEGQTSQQGAPSPLSPPERHNSRLPPPPGFPERNIPLRSLRKQLSKATGLHGVITPSSRMLMRGSGTRYRPRSVRDGATRTGPGAKPIPKALVHESQLSSSLPPPPPPTSPTSSEPSFPDDE